MIGLCLLVGSAVTVYADDTAVAEIIVTANSACTVQLDGISENTQGYSDKKELTDKVSFSITYDEPGSYEYELKQVKSDTSEIYDSGVYQVFVNVIYESDVMKTVVTGGIKGTEEKPEQFKFEKVEPAPEESDQSTEPATGIPETSDEREPIQTGDETNLYFWINMLLISGGVLLLLFAVTSMEKKREKKSM